MPKCILTERNNGNGSGGGSAIVLRKIEVTTPPTKTSYLSGDMFNSAGMVITASYGLVNSPAILATAEVTGSCTISPQTLTDGIRAVTISYAEGGITATVDQPVTVTHKLTSIKVSTNPTKITYEYGDTLVTAGAVITATYSDNTTATVTGSYSPTALNKVGTQSIIVTYSENGVNKTTTFNVTVNRKSIAKPTWKANKTYNGNVISVTDTSNWNNFNTSYMTIGGTTSSTNAGTYTATFTPGSNYRWTDGTTSAINVSWTINKAAGSFSLSTSSISLNATNYSTGVTVTVSNPTGTISASSSNNTACPVSVSNNSIVIKGNGSTAGTFTITVSCAASTNYTAPANKTITVTATYWSFGAGTGETADAAWFDGLKTYLKTHTGASLTKSGGGSIVGAEKTVTLSTAVLGTTTHKIRVIGVDQDANNTVAFQTVTCMKSYTAFGGNATWIGSTARAKCQEYYNAFPGKSAIKTIKRGTCSGTNDSRNGSVTYNNETVFLLSEREFGLNAYSPLSTANSTTSNAECAQGKNFSYSYFTSDSTRVFYLDDGTGKPSSAYGYPWERSRYCRSGYSGYVCCVGSSGSADVSTYSYSFGLGPAFVIGN